MVERGRKPSQPSTPPYAPWSEMQKVLQRLRGFTPPRVDLSYLRTYGIASHNERAVINALKFLGLINETGVPTPRLPLLQVKGDAYRENLSQIVREVYRDLLERVDLADATPETILNYFRTRRIGGSVAPKCARFFLGIIRETDMARGAMAQAPKRAVAAEFRPEKRPSHPGRAARERLIEKRAQQASKPASLMEAKLKLFEKLPSFDATWKPEAIKLIFEELHRLADRLEEGMAEEDKVGARAGNGRGRR